MVVTLVEVTSASCRLHERWVPGGGYPVPPRSRGYAFPLPAVGFLEENPENPPSGGEIFIA